MEHRNSTVISGTRDIRDSATQLISAVAHEFFHSWDVKRIRPKALEPFDYENPNMSGELWFAEGFTNYYGPLSLKRAGIESIERFVRGQGGAVNSVLYRARPPDFQRGGYEPSRRLIRRRRDCRHE